MALNCGQFCPFGNLWQCLETFSFHNGGGHLLASYGCRPKMLPTILQYTVHSLITTKQLSGLNVNSAVAERPALNPGSFSWCTSHSLTLIFLISHDLITYSTPYATVTLDLVGILWTEDTFTCQSRFPLSEMSTQFWGLPPSQHLDLSLFKHLSTESTSITILCKVGVG